VVLAVYTGTSCQTLSCLLQVPAGINTLKWFAEEDQQYWILVNGASSSDSGEYSLMIMVSSTIFIPLLFKWPYTNVIQLDT
jgi:hypothetical protein